MQLQFSHIIYLVAFWGAITLLWWLFAGRKQKAMQADTKDARKNWAQGIYSVVTGGEDYGFSDKYNVLLALSNSWSINGENDFRRRFSELISAPGDSKSETAWNLARAVNLSRMAAGAKLISNEESWQLIYPLLPRIQQSFSSWEDFGASYQTAYAQWISGGQINEKQIKDRMKTLDVLKKDVWEQIDFSQSLN